MGRPVKQINLPPPPAEEVSLLVAQRNGFKTDAANVSRRTRHAERVRYCPDCELRLNKAQRLCDDCAAKRQGRYRVCLGAYGRPCPDQERVWDRNLRCWMCKELRAEELREQRKLKRRGGRPLVLEVVDHEAV